MKLQRHGRAGATSSRRGFAVNGQQANRPWIMKGDEPVSADDLPNSQLEDIDAVDSHLHVALVSLIQGMAYDVVYNSRKKRGLDACRRLCFTYEPHNNRTNIRLLRRILNPPRSTMSTLRSSLDKLESDIIEYEGLWFLGPKV